MSILVTGGGRGIGRAIVELVAGGEEPVAFTWRTDEGVARELEAASGARAFRLDVCDAAAVSEVVRTVEAEVGPCTGLVNNAGVRAEGLLAMTPDEDWARVLEVNLTGAFRACRAVLPGMLHRRKGAIVNVASLAAVAGVPGQAAYAASKAGLLGMTRSLAREVGRRSVRVNAVLPGFVATDMTSDVPPETVARLRTGECLPSGTAASDVAEAVAFLLSDRARAITGQALIVDAGCTA